MKYVDLAKVNFAAFNPLAKSFARRDVVNGSYVTNWGLELYVERTGELVARLIVQKEDYESDLAPILEKFFFSSSQSTSGWLVLTREYALAQCVAEAINNLSSRLCPKPVGPLNALDRILSDEGLP